MPKDFDVERAIREQRERTFTIGGETFTYRPAVAPEAIISWSKMTSGENADMTEEDAIKVYDDTVLAFLEPGQDDKWRAVRAIDRAHPLAINDIAAVVRWLFEEQTLRPTGPQSDSLVGSESGETGTPLRDVSASPAAVPG